MRETTIKAYCDFSNQVAKHPAEYTINTPGAPGSNLGTSTDACKKHLTKMIGVLLALDDLHDIRVSLIPNNDAIKHRNGKAVPTGEDYKCAACERTFDTVQGRALHYRRTHEKRK